MVPYIFLKLTHHISAEGSLSSTKRCSIHILFENPILSAEVHRPTFGAHQRQSILFMKTQHQKRIWT